MVLKNQKGFTLIELLVVVAIIGILAAIAIPQFAAYRAQAFCAGVESDVKNTVIAQEGVFADTQAYDAAVEVQSGANVITPTVSAGPPPSIDVTGTNPNCTKGTFSFTGTTGVYVWQ
jgi:type IV pilus assembly protein PilA